MFEIDKEKNTVKTNDYDYVVNSIIKSSYQNLRVREALKGIIYYFKEKDGKSYINSVVAHIDDIENIVYTLFHCGQNIWIECPYDKTLLKKKASRPTLRRRFPDSRDFGLMQDWMGFENSDHGPSHGLILGFMAAGMENTADKILEKEFSSGLGRDVSDEFSLSGMTEDPDLINLRMDDLIKNPKILNRKYRNKSEKKIKIPEDNYKPLFKRILNKRGIKHAKRKN